MRNLNPAVRRITRSVLKFPPLKELPECSWPKGQGECLLSKRRGDTAKLIPESYEVRSVGRESEAMESNECAIGPEFYGLFRNEEDVRTVAEALVDAEVHLGKLTKEDRSKVVKQIEETIKGDLRGRSMILYSYASYFVLGGFLLYQLAGNSRVTDEASFLENTFSQLVLGILPLITSFYLHNIYGERVRKSQLLHLLPISILLSYVLRDTSLFLLTTALTIVLTIYVISKFRTTYVTCSMHQLNRQLDSRPVVLIAIFGIVVPSVLLSLPK